MTARTLAAASLLLVAGCDISSEFLMERPIEDVPGLVDLGTIVPVTATSPVQIAAGTIYGELGPTGTALPGGLTFSFVGTGSSVCVWVDPELLSWSQSVSPTTPAEQWQFPDNIYDDGDLDLGVGLTAFYNGTPGELMGDFEVRFEDSLGNQVPVDLVECTIFSSVTGTTGSHGGRGAPEYCTVPDTSPGVSYSVAMETWSLPIDDKRLGYGLIVADGSCQDLKDNAGAGRDLLLEECLITGESILPNEAQGERAAAAGLPSPTWIGADEVPTWDGSIGFETAYCLNPLAGGGPGGGSIETPLTDLCVAEQNAVIVAGAQCSWEVTAGTDDKVRCYCGDIEDTPIPGSL